MAKETYYQTLGVNQKATNKDIRKAYIALALKYHPDKNKSKGAQQKFQEIAQAYDTLSDPEKRRRYDAFLINPQSERKRPNTSRTYANGHSNRHSQFHQQFFNFPDHISNIIDAVTSPLFGVNFGSVSLNVDGLLGSIDPLMHSIDIMFGDGSTFTEPASPTFFAQFSDIPRHGTGSHNHNNSNESSNNSRSNRNSSQNQTSTNRNFNSRNSDDNQSPKATKSRQSTFKPKKKKTV